ncbi:hypothetical protein, partial [Rhizobium leguminosarum]|uniref:hypothetical protein n=1 Tax=Rhizobium leguminosarum TaxID=384 RepID=UPI00143F45EC
MSDHHDQTSSKVRLTQFWMLIDSVERLAQTIERRQEVELLLEDAERQIGTAEEVSEGRHRRDEIDHELEEKTVVLGAVEVQGFFWGLFVIQAADGTICAD